MSKYVLLLGALSIIGPWSWCGSAQAQHIRGFDVENTSTTMYDLPPVYDEKEGEVTLFTEEPFFEKIKLLRLDPPMSLRERVERLVYGIYTDVPPEYDHYGYEIRRHMAGVGNATFFHDPAFIEKQLKNIKTSEIILKYWGEVLREEAEEVERLIKEKKDASSTRTTFKYNRGVVNAFLVECQSWINNNKMALEYLQKIGPRAYRYNPKKGIISFKSKENFKEFASIYESKLRSVREIRGYLPFRMMVY